MLETVSALAGVVGVGRHGVSHGAPGLLIQELDGLQIVSLAARRGQRGTLSAAVQQRWGVDLPGTPRCVVGEGVTFVWSGADQWLAIADADAGDLEAELRAAARSLASITAQGDGRVVLRLSGPAVRDLLSGVVAIDLHPRVFRPGDTALTLAGHVGVQIRQIDETPCFEMMALRSYAGSLVETVLEVGLKFGVEILATG
jgi:sarcosine oxidase subunit gamma